MNPNKKFVMEHIQNATLAGGVAIGAVADLLVGPWAALTIGSMAGMICVFGFNNITVKHRIFTHRISANSFRGNYSFLREKYVPRYFHIVPTITLLLNSKKKIFKGGSFSWKDSIQRASSNVVGIIRGE